MGLDEKVRTLALCTRQLGASPNALDTLDGGFLLLQSLSADTKLCDKVTQKLSGFGELLSCAAEEHKTVTSLIKTRSAGHLTGLTDLKTRFEEGNTTAALTELRSFGAFLETVDGKLGDCERALTLLQSWIRSLDTVCARHGRTKTTAGGVFLASGCLALTISAATFLIKFAVHSTGGNLSPAAALLFRFSPLNTALAGGVVTMLGFSDARHSQRYSKLTSDFRSFADDLQQDIALSRSFRTRVQRLRHAIDDLALSLHVTTAIHRIDPTTWKLLVDWIPDQEQALRRLNTLG